MNDNPTSFIAQNGLCMLVDLFATPGSGLKIERLVWGEETYPECFFAKDLVNWFVVHGVDRTIGVSISQRLVLHGFIQPLWEGEEFTDSRIFFKVISSLLNDQAEQPIVREVTVDLSVYIEKILLSVTPGEILRLILSYTYLLDQFKQFLQQILADENLTFYLSVVQFEKLKSNSERLDVAGDIYQEYIDRNARQCLNITDSVFQAISQSLNEENASELLFEEAKEQIVDLLKIPAMDFFFDFLKPGSVKRDELTPLKESDNSVGAKFQTVGRVIKDAVSPRNKNKSNLRSKSSPLLSSPLKVPPLSVKQKSDDFSVTIQPDEVPASPKQSIRTTPTNFYSSFENNSTPDSSYKSNKIIKGKFKAVSPRLFRQTLRTNISDHNKKDDSIIFEYDDTFIDTNKAKQRLSFLDDKLDSSSEKHVSISPSRTELHTHLVYITGHELVEWFIRIGIATTRENAVILGQQLLGTSLLISMEDGDFRDNKQLYRYTTFTRFKNDNILSGEISHRNELFSRTRSFSVDSKENSSSSVQRNSFLVPSTHHHRTGSANSGGSPRDRLMQTQQHSSQKSSSIKVNSHSPRKSTTRVIDSDDTDESHHEELGEMKSNKRVGRSRTGSKGWEEETKKQRQSPKSSKKTETPCIPVDQYVGHKSRKLTLRKSYNPEMKSKKKSAVSLRMKPFAKKSSSPETKMRKLGTTEAAD